ncbi:hypothetical protein [Yinghuangia sp. YIM S09857]|uniref:hypothetical protein n=1 Tax=Yinghuangia sp. YIM S09857 TaxID=3436929 RepID=UPI003F53A7AA
MAPPNRPRVICRIDDTLSPDEPIQIALRPDESGPGVQCFSFRSTMFTPRAVADLESVINTNLESGLWEWVPEPAPAGHSGPGWADIVWRADSSMPGGQLVAIVDAPELLIVAIDAREVLDPDAPAILTEVGRRFLATGHWRRKPGSA